MAPNLRPMTPEEVAAKSGQVVELPPFEDGTPFVARLRRGGLVKLLLAKKLPNPLLAKAVEALEGKLEINKELGRNPHETVDLLNALCAATLVEPPWEAVRDYLTDEQILSIVSYAQAGVAALESFRRGQGADASNRGDGQGVGDAAEPADRGS